MNLRHLNNNALSGRLLCAMLAAALLGFLASPIAIHGSSAPDEWDEVFDTARSVLAKLPDTARIEATIKDPGLRKAVLQAYGAVKACAKVNKAQSTSQKRAFFADFERAFAEVQKEAERGEYQACAAQCKTDGAKCEQDCASAKKKLCACKLTQFGFFASRCLFP